MLTKIIKALSGWKGYIVALIIGSLLVSAGVATWEWQGSRNYKDGYGQAEKDISARLASESLASASRLAALESAHREIERLAHEKESALAAAVDTGRVRLRVQATCPSPKTANASVGNGASPELAATARPAYFALRSGMIKMRSDLDMCRASVRELTAP